MFLKTLFTAFAVAVLLAGGVIAADGLISWQFAGDLAFLLGLGLAIAIVVQTIRIRRRARFLQAGIVLALGAAALTAAPKLIPASRRVYFGQRRGHYQELADLIIRSHIRTFWDPPGENWVSLNGRFIALSDTPPATIGILANEVIIPLDTALKDSHISPQFFSDLRERLSSLHATSFTADSNVIYIGGRDAGFVYLPPGRAAPRVRDHLGGLFLAAQLTDRWYYAYR